jgi:hypothetical protein
MLSSNDHLESIAWSKLGVSLLESVPVLLK